VKGAKIMVLIKLISTEEQHLIVLFFAWKFSNHSMVHQEVFHPVDSSPLNSVDSNELQAYYYTYVDPDL